MNALRFTVPGPPVPQARARSRYSGRPYMPRKSRAYQAHVAIVAWNAMCLSLPRWPVGGAGPFAVSLEVYRAADRGDADNYAKGVKDAMTRARVWDDDRHVTSLTVRMFVDRERPRVEVEVTRLSPKADTEGSGE